MDQRETSKSNKALLNGQGLIQPVVIPSHISSSDSSEALESSKDGARTPSGSRKPVSRERTLRHKRYFSYPGTPSHGHVPVGYAQPYSYGAPHYHGQKYDGGEYGANNHYYQGMQMYNPWVSGYEMQWNAYGAYVMSNVMSRRSDAPTRIIFIGNLSTSIDEKKVIECASKFGVVRGVDSSQREYSYGVFISYWDIRQAEEAVKGFPEALSGPSQEEAQSQCMAYYMQPPLGVAGMENQGIIAITAAKDVSMLELKDLCAKFGEVKDTWKPNPTDDVRCIEFYDCRVAEEAVAGLKSAKYSNIILSVEISTLPAADRFQHPIPSVSSYHSSSSAYGMKPEDSPFGVSDTEATASWAMQSPYPWNHYSLPHSHSMPHSQPHHQYPHQSYASSNHHRARSDVNHEVGGSPSADEGSFHGQDSAWHSHYMGYHPSMHHWPYQHHGHVISPHAMYDGMMSGVVHHNGHHPSSSNGSNTSEGNNWKQGRTRSGTERNYDPSQFEFNLEEAASDSADARTTLMIRNIPNKYSQKMLLDVLNKKYRGRYDFFYLPIDFKNRCNLGYSFVNFIDSSTTAEFYKEFHTKSWEEFNSKKVCEITYARVQGRNNLIEHFRNSRFPCNDPDYLPLVFETEKGSQRTVAKGIPVSHWATITQYPSNQPVVAAH